MARYKYKVFMKAFYREYRLPIHTEAALNILRGKQVTYLGDVYGLDVREEIEAYAKSISSVISRYLEKLPRHPDLGIIGGGGAAIKELLTSRYGSSICLFG